MPKKIKSDSIKAELTSLEKLIKEAEQYGDFVALSQFKYKFDELQKELQELNVENENVASIALYFSGKPVYGSKGIDSDFAGIALETFQEMISKIFSIDEAGSQAQRGKVAFKKHSKLAITGVSKGSFGFILDEITDQASFVKTELKHVVENLTSILDKTVGEDEEEFNSVVEQLDRRTLSSINRFLRNLDSHEATLRLIEGNTEHKFNASSIKLGRARVESTQIQAKTEKITGKLTGFLPDSKRFELVKDKSLIKGGTSKDAVKRFLELLQTDSKTLSIDIIGTFEVKTIQRFGTEPRVVYRLLDFKKLSEKAIND